MTLPDELVEAARIDGASPMRFFCDIVFPLSKTNLAALFVITFIYGWNQYLWPLLIITDVDLGTTVAGIKGMIATGEGTTEGMELSDGGDVVNPDPTSSDCFSDAACLRARPGR